MPVFRPAEDRVVVVELGVPSGRWVAVDGVARPGVVLVARVVGQAERVEAARLDRREHGVGRRAGRVAARRGARRGAAAAALVAAQAVQPGADRGQHEQHDEREHGPADRRPVARRPGGPALLLVGWRCPGAATTAVLGGPGVGLVVLGEAGPGRGGGRRRGHRGRDDLEQRVREQAGGGQHRAAAPLQLEQGLAGHFVDGRRDAGADLVRAARLAVGQRGGRQAAHARAGPVPGQRRVQQHGQAAGVGQGRIVRGHVGQRRVDAGAGDLHPAAGRPAQRLRGQAEVRHTGRVRRGQRLGRLGHDLGTPRGLQWAVREQVVQRVTGYPLHHHIGLIPVVLDVEHLGQPRVGEPARGARRGEHLTDPRETRREREYRDRPGQRLVDGLPGRPATAVVDPVLEPVAAAEPGTRF